MWTGPFFPVHSCILRPASCNKAAPSSQSISDCMGKRVCVCVRACVHVWWGGECSHPSPMEGKLDVMRASGWGAGEAAGAGGKVRRDEGGWVGGWGGSWGWPSRCTPGPLDRTDRSGLPMGSHQAP